MALSLVLLVTAAALLDGFRKMAGVDPGIRTDHVMMMEFDPALVQYRPDQTREFYRLLLERARALPGVRSATVSSSLPFRPNFADQVVIPEGYLLPKDQVGLTVSSNVVDEQYFRTMATTLVKGRGFTSEDGPASRRVAVVNEESPAASGRIANRSAVASSSGSAGPLSRWP